MLSVCAEKKITREKNFSLQFYWTLQKGLCIFSILTIWILFELNSNGTTTAWSFWDNGICKSQCSDSLISIISNTNKNHKNQRYFNILCGAVPQSSAACNSQLFPYSLQGGCGWDGQDSSGGQAQTGLYKAMHILSPHLNGFGGVGAMSAPQICCTNTAPTNTISATRYPK